MSPPNIMHTRSLRAHCVPWNRMTLACELCSKPYNFEELNFLVVKEQCPTHVYHHLKCSNQFENIIFPTCVLYLAPLNRLFAFVFVSFMTNIRITNMKKTEQGNLLTCPPLTRILRDGEKRKVFLCGLRAFVWKELLSFQRVITNEKYHVCIVIFIIFVIGCFFLKRNA